MRAFIWLIFCLWGTGVVAGIVLNKEHDAIHITDYPAEAPCTLSRIMAVDKAFGWGRVHHDDVSNIYTITGNLLIGANDEISPTHKLGSDAVLRIGSTNKPHETLIMRGNIFVSPYWIDGENPGAYWSVARKNNMLVIGDKKNADLRGALKFACSTNENYTLYCGRLPWNKASQFGGGVYVYNSEIAALHPGADGLIGDAARGDMHLWGGVVFVNARISDVRGRLIGMQAAGTLKDYLLQDTRFERIGSVFDNGIQKASGCVFADCGTVVLDQGGLCAELSDCVFRNNDCNWALIFYGSLALIDCEWEAPRKGNRHSVWINRQGIKQYPQLTVSRSLVVEVKDASGKPVANAVIKWRVEQNERNKEIPRRTGLSRTGKDGRTPSKGESGALALVAYIETATDLPDKPALEKFSYTLMAEKNGRHTAITNVVPDTSWKNVVLKFDNAQ